ncbi:MAG: hypothetical protein RI909_2278 [Bacteroidota bacterium]|jgi:predicted Holliday junction resolvase-like endonuclease
MKKVIVMFSFVLFAGATQVIYARAAEVKAASSTFVVEQQDEKVKIKKEDLPVAVKKTLEGDAYKGWAIEEVFHNKTKDSYELSVKKGAEARTLKFNKDGSEIE